MSDMLHNLLPWLAILPSCGYGIFTLDCARRWFARNRPPCGNSPAVTVLKPVKGMDEESFENFASFCRQEYAGEVQLLFAAASADDPVLPVVRSLMAAFPEADIELVVDAATYGPNHKVSNLMNAFRRARHDIIIVCDSDIRVTPGYLDEVCAPFADPAVGLVTSLYRSPGVRGAATAVEAMGFTAEMVPNVMAAMRLEGLSFALGASMAVRRQALEDIGGFASLVDYLADDYQLGNRVWKAGWRLELSDCFVESVMKRESWSQVLSRQLRWARTMRASRPGGWFASVMTHPFPGAAAALLFGGFSTAGWGAAAFLYLLRSLICTFYSRVWIGDRIFPRWLPLLPLRDFFSFLTWFLSFTGNRVTWRGHRFRLLSGGRIVEERPEAA